MNQESENSDALVRRVLRDLPPRRAPAALELRVLRELEYRATLAWWRRGFAHWPIVARAVFVFLCTILIACSLLGEWWMPIGTRASWLPPMFAALSSMRAFAMQLTHFIPPDWFYGAAAGAAALYATLFGLGAAAYRTLYRQPLRTGQLL